MTPNVEIRLAGPDDSVAIAGMLRRLAEEIGDGDRFRSDAATVRRHGFGASPLFHSLIATEGAENLGLALFFPGYSTTLATPYFATAFGIVETDPPRLPRAIISGIA